MFPGCNILGQIDFCTSKNIDKQKVKSITPASAQAWLSKEKSKVGYMFESAFLF